MQPESVTSFDPAHMLFCALGPLIVWALGFGIRLIWINRKPEPEEPRAIWRATQHGWRDLDPADQHDSPPTWRRPDGQGLIEYALLLALVALIVIVVLVILGPSTGNLYSNILQAFEVNQ